MIPWNQFFAKLVTYQIRQQKTELPDLVKYLAWSEDPQFCDVRKLVKATEKFIKSNHLKSFGMTKCKLQDATLDLEEDDGMYYDLFF